MILLSLWFIMVSKGSIWVAAVASSIIAGWSSTEGRLSTDHVQLETLFENCLCLKSEPTGPLLLPHCSHGPHFTAETSGVIVLKIGTFLYCCLPS
jgi:hypothetical protein